MTSTTATGSLPARLAVRFAIAATLAVSGVIHAYLYVDGGYRYIPTVGSGFLVQASVFCALARLALATASRSPSARA